jgi:hypothetical protein
MQECYRLIVAGLDYLLAQDWPGTDAAVTGATKSAMRAHIVTMR